MRNPSHRFVIIKIYLYAIHVQIRSEIVPYTDFEQVILVFKSECIVQSQHMEGFFLERVQIRSEIIPYTDFEQVILVFKSECIVQSQHMEGFFWSESHCTFLQAGNLYIWQRHCEHMYFEVMKTTRTEVSNNHTKTSAPF